MLSIKYLAYNHLNAFGLEVWDLNTQRLKPAVFSRERHFLQVLAIKQTRCYQYWIGIGDAGNL